MIHVIGHDDLVMRPRVHFPLNNRGEFEAIARETLNMSGPSTVQSFFVSAEVPYYEISELTYQASISVLLTAAYGFWTAKVFFALSFCAAKFSFNIWMVGRQRYYPQIFLF